MRADERTPTEVGRRSDFGHQIKDREKTIPRLAVPSEPVAQQLLAALVSGGEVRADQPRFAAKAVVERCLGDTRVLDHAIDANGVDACPVEKLVGGC